MSRDALEQIHGQVLDLELGLYVIRAVAVSHSPADSAPEVDRRFMALDWVASRLQEKAAEVSQFAEEQARTERDRRRP